ncbi:hypothetical protein Q4485_12215 [Granulosicoccaceae sp. 1_MG-2023]|nr:hypothetical protein [Granulosicoccaceae sp. 1_MG-2023]
MAKNLKFYRDELDVARARGPISEKLLTIFLETDLQDDTIALQALMDDLWAVEHGHADEREFTGNAHTVVIKPEGIVISSNADEAQPDYVAKLKHFSDVLQDWEAFI